MAKASSSKPPSTRSNPGAGLTIIRVIDIFTRFGIGGGIIVVVTIVFLIWGSPEQKREFIDRYVLFKWPKGQEGYPFFVLLIILIIFIIIWNFYHHKIKLKDEKIKILTAELEKYQR